MNTHASVSRDTVRKGIVGLVGVLVVAGLLAASLITVDHKPLPTLMRRPLGQSKGEALAGIPGAAAHDEAR